MQTTEAIIRKADELYRIVIPREIRAQLHGIDAGAEFEIMLVAEDKIMMRLIREE